MLNSDDSILVLVDVQEKLIGVMHESEQLLDVLCTLLTSAAVLHIPIVVTEQLPDKLGPTVASLKAEVGNGQPVIKSSFSCCGADEFNRALTASGRNQVVVCGIEAHVCVQQTVLELLDRGYEVQVAADAVTSRKPFNRDIAIEKMRQAGAVITSLETCVFEWLRRAEGDDFRSILKCIK